ITGRCQLPPGWGWHTQAGTALASFIERARADCDSSVALRPREVGRPSRRANASIDSSSRRCAPLLKLAEDRCVAGGVESGEKRQQVGNVEKRKGEAPVCQDVLAVFVESKRLQRSAVESPDFRDPQSGVDLSA